VDDRSNPLIAIRDACSASPSPDESASLDGLHDVTTGASSPVILTA
jgi:hypothetical protein